MLTLLAPALVVASCSSSPDGEPAPPDSPESQEVVLEELPPLDFPVYTREDWLGWQANSEYLDELEERPEMIREVSMAESLQVHSDCLTEAGLPEMVDSINSDGIGREIPVDQIDAYGRADITCKVMYPVALRYYQHRSAEQLRLLYDWQVNEVIPCLEGYGERVSEPPTFESFYGTYASNGYEVWLAIGHIESGGDEIEYHDLCPAYPPDEVFFGGG